MAEPWMPFSAKISEEFESITSFMLFVQAPASLGCPLLFQMVTQCEPVKWLRLFCQLVFHPLKVILDDFKDISVALSNRSILPRGCRYLKDAFFT